MLIRQEKIKLVSNNREELMAEATREILDKNNSGWRINFLQQYEDIDGHAVILEAERRFRYEEVKDE